MNIKSKERDLFNKLCRFCAYRERAISEVIAKMFELGVDVDLQFDFLVHLKEGNYLNENRFAKAYAQGKFKSNHWGRIKINHGLKLKKIKAIDIKQALESIDEEEYCQKMKSLIHKQDGNYKIKNILERRKKIADYLQRKGYEIQIVWELLKQELPD